MNGIGDYGVIGDCHSLALVGRDGSIDWCCFPRFDSPSVFGRVLDPDRGGHFALGPAPAGSGAATATSRRYLPATNVLCTRFEVEGGVLELTDCMPVARYDPEHPARVTAQRALLRRVRCLEGQVECHLDLRPRPEYGVVTPRFTATSATTCAVVGGPDALWVRATDRLHPNDDHVAARWDFRAGDEHFVEMTWTPAADPEPDEGGDPRASMARHLDDTISFWQDWFASGGGYEGEHERTVHRSALILKALTYAPTGAVVAAGTTSLPEWAGNTRNWDYRFTWIRDATLTLSALTIVGSLAEAEAFKGWLERTGAGRPEDLQIMYRVTGERLLPEIELDHLSGHRDSRPVRVGNAAAGQRQLDAYGQVIEAAHLFVQAGGALTESNGTFLSRVADQIVATWQQPDQGIWEIRDDPRHFVHSKLCCWVGLDRAVRLAGAGHITGAVSAWTRERDRLADWLLGEGAPQGWFVQAGGHAVADASALQVPALGFLPVSHPMVAETVEVVSRDLRDGPFVHRYLVPDGLPGQEGAFLLCSFWLLDCLIHAGRLDEADTLLDSLLDLSNDVGVFSEMVDPATGEALGNTPQAFTHMAVITSCEALTAARRGRLPPPDEAQAFASGALLRRR
ncbi:MAG: glycoside hydrolase family 15 protein [Acidimicrobiales bacterium]|nr:glycoside hydrolase family 15 protein [Acidimicrobiales bacterium]